MKPCQLRNKTCAATFNRNRWRSCGNAPQTSLGCHQLTSQTASTSSSSPSQGRRHPEPSSRGIAMAEHRHQRWSSPRHCSRQRLGRSRRQRPVPREPPQWTVMGWAIPRRAPRRLPWARPLQRPVGSFLQTQSGSFAGWFRRSLTTLRRAVAAVRGILRTTATTVQLRLLQRAEGEHGLKIVVVASVADVSAAPLCWQSQRRAPLDCPSLVETAW